MNGYALTPAKEDLRRARITLYHQEAALQGDLRKVEQRRAKIHSIREQIESLELAAEADA